MKNFNLWFLLRNLVENWINIFFMGAKTLLPYIEHKNWLQEPLTPKKQPCHVNMWGDNITSYVIYMMSYVILLWCFYMLTHISFHLSKTIKVTLTSYITLQLDFGGRSYCKSHFSTWIQSISVTVQSFGLYFYIL